MKVTIRGNNPVTPEQFKSVIEDLNSDYDKLGLVVKNMTCYVRFQDVQGNTLEPVLNGQEIERTFTLTKEIDASDKNKKKKKQC